MTTDLMGLHNVLVCQARVNDVDLSGIKNQLQENAQQIAALTTLVSKIVPGNESTARVCGVCSDFSHATDECPTLQSEDVNALGGFPGQSQRKYDPFSNTYNEGWKDHPNLRYGPRPPFSHSNQTRPFVQQNSQQQSGSSLEDLVKQLTTQIGQVHSQGVQYQKKTDTHLHHIDTQIGQISTSLSNLESQLSNRLPSQTLANPNEHAKVVTLRSGKELKEPKIKNREIEKEVEVRPKDDVAGESKEKHDTESEKELEKKDSFDACDWMAQDVFDEWCKNLFENGVFGDFKETKMVDSFVVSSDVIEPDACDGCEKSLPSIVPKLIPSTEFASSCAVYQIHKMVDSCCNFGHIHKSSIL
uniref:Uncharacterized protein n=1 Tax=Chenopodium quinoa TaxID=63459 RepID=A0A803MYY1_CHEQI